MSGVQFAPRYLRYSPAKAQITLAADDSITRNSRNRPSSITYIITLRLRNALIKRNAIKQIAISCEVMETRLSCQRTGILLALISGTEGNSLAPLIRSAIYLDGAHLVCKHNQVILFLRKILRTN